ncbi:putative RING finger protein [Paratrimastix pyriformis]|uniref:RING finger protein n=1 Tax=Paratrimastix pyriformis TaxID=342808 RepID=A0ABQ8UGF1_9EUKA|nr:putative RING finger protein [Paratrimastix pyriformis]
MEPSTGVAAPEEAPIIPKRKPRNLRKRDDSANMGNEETGAVVVLKKPRESSALVATTKRSDEKDTGPFRFSASGTAARLGSDDQRATATLEIDDPTRTNKNAKIGPVKASSNIRISCRFDYQPDLCKDYYETGYCCFGDACKFMHCREDYKTGWQLEQEWDAQKKQEREDAERRAAHAAQLLAAGKNLEEEAAADAEDAEFGDLPFACHICRKGFVDPIVTRCGHFFCQTCAIRNYAKSPRCPLCGEDTMGVFNIATELRTDKAKRFIARMAARAPIEEAQEHMNEERREKRAQAQGENEPDGESEQKDGERREGRGDERQ